ncbi:hypothetical protein CCAX7_15980 [Capsulimonas corticalis]|uniref:Uncharacterized protein n=1 Tax=Capsulimonas corticalis TaxID=2219043 RepID=A0A402CZ13_9BACT|nr:hypothetical protein [Capsulimonas corticalis]BDI29547.1 hypothetical protein CCAX7_15980 [Capsulimonas corticalis]
MNTFRIYARAMGAALLAGGLLAAMAGCGHQPESTTYTKANPSAQAPAAPGGPPGSGVPGGPSSNK